MGIDSVQATSLPHRTLEAALLRVAAHRQLSVLNVAAYRMLGDIEGCAHELAHALDLGPDFEVQIRSMEGDEANKHEASVLRIEVTALAVLGVHLSMRRLRAFANWRDDMRAPLAQLQAPLNRHEWRCTQRFVALILHEVRSMASSP